MGWYFTHLYASGNQEIYGLTSQLRRAAVSVPANIAEGSQRQYLKEYLQFLHIAKSSLVSERLGYLPGEEARKLSELREGAAKTLYGLIGWVKRQIEVGKVTKDDLQKQT